MNFGERLRKLRGTRSKKEFADIIGVHVNTLGNYERGDRTPDVDFASSLCEKLGVSPSWLLLGEGILEASKGSEPPPSPELKGESFPASSQERDLDDLRRERMELRQECRELREENRELRKEVKDLWKENADLRVENAELRARLPDDEELPSEAAQRSA